MDKNLHKKFFSALLSVDGLSIDNTFFQKADINVKIFPRYIFSVVSTTSNYSTNGKYESESVQVSMFDYFQSGKVLVLKETAGLIEQGLTRTKLAGTITNAIVRCKLDNTRESEYDGIFQIDLTFKINLTKEK